LEVDSQAVDKRGDRVRAMFASIAGRYDLLNHLLSLNIDKSWRTFTIKKLAPTAGQRILDVCTGTGDLALGFAARVPKVEVIGLDFCPEMLDVARQKNAKATAKVLQFGDGDATQLPVESNAFDIVTCAFGLRNVSDTERGIDEMIRVAKIGGKVGILEFSKPRVPILRWCYLAYFKYLLPKIGQQVSGNDHGAYEYLPASVLAFPDGPVMVELLTSRGLRDVVAYPLTLGIATLYVGSKSTPKERR
jgi:demethylmenaquinone methyltransferase / 2-methoxy-6-polyprenyl-1,4-benzoquinol methylase